MTSPIHLAGSFDSDIDLDLSQLVLPQGEPGPAGPPGVIEGLPTAFDFGCQYVHSSAPDDSKDGLSIYTPKQTVEAAVGDLPDGGVVVLSKGRHDVGDGLQLNRTHPISFRGMGRWHSIQSPSGQPTYPANDPCLYSSTGAQTLVGFAGSSDAQGFRFKDVVFELSPTTIYGIEGRGVSYTTVDDCYFWSKNPAAIGIQADNTVGTDSSWWRVYNSNFVGCIAINGEGTQFNNWSVRDNIVFGASPNLPYAMLFENINRSLISNNNLEGSMDAGIQLGKTGGTGAFDNTLIGNGGENVPLVYDLVHAAGNTIIANGEKVNGQTLIHFKGAGQNVLIAPGRIYPPNPTLSYLDDEIIDDNGHNTIITPHSLKVYDTTLYLHT